MKSFAGMESVWVLKDGLLSLINNINTFLEISWLLLVLFFEAFASYGVPVLNNA